MRNLLNNKDFKKLKELQKLNENMDFSNDIGWSETLVGSLLNKLFSFAAKNIKMVILSRLKKKLEDQYLKAALITLSKYEVKLEQEEHSNIVVFNFSAISVDEKYKKSATIIGKDLHIQLPDGQDLNNWKTKIEGLNGTTWKILYTKDGKQDSIENEQLSPLLSTFDIEFTAANGKTKDTYSVTVNDAKNGSTDLDVYVQDNNNDNSGSIVYPEISENTYSFNIESMENKRFVLIPITPTTTITPGDDDGERYILDITEEQHKFTITAANGNTREITCVVKVEAKDDDKEEPKALGQGEQKPKALGVGKKYELMKKMDVETQSRQIELYKNSHRDDCLSENDSAILLKTIEKIESQIKKTNKLSNLLDNAQEPSDAIAKYVKNKDNIKSYGEKLSTLLNDLKQKYESITDKKELSDEEVKQLVKSTIQKSETTQEETQEVQENPYKDVSMEELKTKIKEVEPGSVEYKKIDSEIQRRNKKELENYEKNKEKYKAESEEVIKKMLQRTDLSDEDKKRLNKAIAVAKHLDTVGDPSAWRKFKDIIKKIDSTYEFVNESRYTHYLRNKYYAELDAMYEGIQSTEDVDTSVNSVMGQYKSDDMKKVLKNYGNVKLDKVPPNQMADWFNDPNEGAARRAEATKNVDKEALKEIALKAEYIYNQEKYKDESSKTYTRVNFTTTVTDMKKLERKWEILKRKAKSAFSSFFVDENNNFPQILDPNALLNSDTAFIKTFGQYQEENPGKTRLGDPNPINPDDPDVLKKLKIMNTEDGLKKGNYGLITFKPTTIDKELGMAVKKIEIQINNEKINAFKFIGLFDFTIIYNGVNENKELSENDIEDLISKNNYSGIQNITDNIEDSNLKNEILRLYQDYRPTSNPLFQSTLKKSGIGKPSGKKIATFFVSKKNAKTGAKKFLHFNINIDPKKSFISRIKDSKSIIAFESVLPQDSTKANYDFGFTIIKTYSIDDSVLDFWKLVVNKNEEKTKTDALVNNPEVHGMINELLLKK